MKPRASVDTSLPPTLTVPHPAVETPGAMASFARLEGQLSDMQQRFEQREQDCAEGVGALKAACDVTYCSIEAFHGKTDEADRRASATMAEMEESFGQSLQSMVDDHARCLSLQVAGASKELRAVQSELHGVVHMLPDVGLLAAGLGKVRDALEAERNARRKAEEFASQTLDAQISAFRDEVSGEASAVAAMRGAMNRRNAEIAQELRGDLQDVRQERVDRYQALEEVVNRLRHSLQITVDEVADLPPVAPAARAWRSSALRPPAPEVLPGSPQREARQRLPASPPRGAGSPLQLPAAPAALLTGVGAEGGPKRAPGLRHAAGSLENSSGVFIGK